ncbi:hypothetical protein D1B31_05805 [Neobacillus notoginsengisoli]|uniref:Uncharacterized protein n=1 Tax=Neobacillus notoginsengisoli TaxID=1578198 RepID=A0A417YXC7_9BACI|nr:hypothetical protein [Neobacillus notoginsengisoli]RHW42150.1 hypothetical protein D1B31_05805 [Neobacillus notoginsengisoli]
MPGTKQFDFVFSTSVTPNPSKEEFIVEFYPCTPDLECNGKPIKITRNFEELIDFIEEMEELENASNPAFNS